MKNDYYSLTTVMKKLHLNTEETLCLIGCGQMTPRILVENIRTQSVTFNGTRNTSYVSGVFSLTPRQCSRILSTGRNTLQYLPDKGNGVIALPNPLIVELSDLIVTNEDYEWIATFYPAHEAPEQTPSSAPHEACTSSTSNVTVAHRSAHL